MTHKAFVALATFGCLAAASSVGAKSLSTLVTDAVRAGADAHPLATAPDLAPAPAEPMAVVPGDPFAAWIVPADGGMDGVLRAGARSVSPGADAAPLAFEDRAGLFLDREEWALWTADTVVNMTRARALHAALRRIERDAKRAGAPATALADARAWVDALRAGSAKRFDATFGRRPPKTLSWARLKDVSRALPRTPDGAINIALGHAPALGNAPQIGAPAGSYSRMQLQDATGLTRISTDRDGPVGADGVSLGVKLHVGIVPGGLSVSSEAADARNAAKRNVAERVVAAYDARRAADAHTPIQKHRIRRFERLLKSFRGRSDPNGAGDAAQALWTETAAEINARHARVFAEAQILAATGRLFDRLYSDDDGSAARAFTAKR